MCEIEIGFLFPLHIRQKRNNQNAHPQSSNPGWSLDSVSRSKRECISTTTLLLEPLLQRWTHKPLDYSAFSKAQADWRQLVLLLLVSWFLAAVLEETIFRGFLITEISSWFNDNLTGVILSILIGSVIFGLAHTYQGKSGVYSTGIVGALLAVIFVVGGFNLWLVIITHGLIDTIGLTLMFFKIDQKVVSALWKKSK